MKIQSLLLILFTAIFISCSQTKQDAPQDVIKKYERLVMDMKADSISQLFTADAEVGHDTTIIAKGRDSIFHFLASFSNVKVLSNKDDIRSTNITGDSATVKGVYTQTVIVNQKDTVNVAGEFTASMIHEKNTWVITRMHTKAASPGN